jgi:hypothetical protein
MTKIYVDPSAANTPDAADHLIHLVETGHEVILVGATSPAVVAGLPAAQQCAEVPADVERGSWYITADPAMCAERQVGLRTLLVGPRAAPSNRPGPRCDAEARDLASAVLEILSRDVMG